MATTWHSEDLLAPPWLRAALGRSPTCVLVLDDRAHVAQVVGDTASVLGADRHDVIGTSLRAAVDATDADRFDFVLDQVEEGAGPTPFQGRFAFAGSTRVLDAVAATDQQHPDGLVVTVTDVTESRRAERLLARRGTVDPLTGLASRGTLLAAARRRVRHAAGTAALVVVDLARVGLVNEAHGPAVGDQLLVAVGRRLREAAGTTDLVARLAGDEFAVLVDDLATHGGTLEAIAARIHGVVEGRVELGATALEVRARVGAQLLGPGDDAARALQQAVSAVADAREQRRWVVVADESLRQRAAARADLLGDLTAAIDDGQITMLYQPIVDPRDDRVVSVEALARWRHPRLGLVGPGSFVPLAEESGAVLQLGRVALDACLHAREALEAAWERPPTVAVNVSPLQLTEGDFLGVVHDLLAAHDRDATGLTFELTESVAHDAVDVVAGLRDTGGHIVIDDFGTGWSSLSLLHRLRVDGLKVDQSFTRRLGTDQDAATLVLAMLALAGALGLDATVEGVETTAQRDLLVGMGVTRCQGHLWHAPLTLDELLALGG